MKLKFCVLWPCIMQLTLVGWMVEGKYPNEIVDTPIVTCEPDKIIIKIRTSSSNPSHIYAEDFHETPKCMVKDQNKIAIAHGDCGMTTEHMDNPAGSMYRICIAVQIHPFFVTDSDRSYCAQCVYMEANVVDDLEQKLAISEMTPNELEPQFDEASNPHCTYSIRKGAVDGPEVHAAVVGETANVGILVQNCHVEDLQGDKILIVDQQGCGVDQYLFKTPEYTDDLHTAFLESNVFKFVDKSMTRFRCQLRLCVKNRGHGCDAITPPNTCSMVDDDSNVVGSSSTASSVLAADDVDQPKRSPVSRLTNPSASSGPPAASNVGTPSTVGRHGVSVEPVGGTRLPSIIVNSGSNTPAQEQMPNTNTKTIGPPSIRPFGLSTAHIVSGKTDGKDTAAAAAMMSSRRNVAVMVQPPASSNQPASPPGPHQSGYSFRNRRSIMIYGNGSRLERDGPAPPNAPINFYRRLQKRHFNSSSAAFADVGMNGTTTPTTMQQVNRKKQLPDMDVVGLIRVLDNPEDLEFYEEKKKSGSNNDKVYVTAETRKYSTSSTLNNEAKDSVTQGLPTAASSEPTAAELGGKARFIVDGQELELEKDGQRCISHTLYWMLISSLGLLAGFQLVGIGLFLADRLILDKTISKRVNNLLHY